MKKNIKRVISLLLSAVMLVSALSVWQFAAYAVSDAGTLDGSSYKLSNIWADPENIITQEDVNAFTSGNVTALAGAVGFHKIQSSGNYYLFLPSNADCNNLRFWFTANTVTLNGVTIQNGQPTNALAQINDGGTTMSFTIVLDGSSHNVTAIKSGGVGAVYIDTSSGTIKNINSSKSNVESGTILVVRPDGTVDYDGILDSMHGRGNASWNQTNKKPYSIKLNQSAKLLGMSKSKKWVLAANPDGLDASHLRNQITYDFADYIGLKYQVHCKPVDLYVNQQYLGSYQLTERVQISSSRIDVTDAYENLEIANGTVDSATGEVIPADLTGTSATSVSSGNSGDVGAKEYSPSLKSPSDVTGGYVFELEISQRWVEDNAGFAAYNGQGWNIKSCDYVSTDMCNYCYDLLYALGGAVYNNGVVPSTSTSVTHRVMYYKSVTKNNPAPAQKYQGKKWSDLLDARSAVLYYWTQEYFMNLDASTTSNYFYKDSDSVDSKIYAGPLWDMDNSFRYNGSESRWGHSCTNAQDWYAKNTAIYRWYPSDALTNYTAGSGMVRGFYGALCYNCPDFWTMAEDYWYSIIEPATQVLLGNKTDETGKLHSIAWYTAQIELSAKMDSVRHGNSSYSASSVTSKMTEWVNKRNNFLNSEISKISITQAANEPVVAQSFTGEELTPSITLTYNNAVLEEGVDYELSYTNNVNVGTATINITGKGRFTGTSSAGFTIIKGDVPQPSIYEAAYAGDTLIADVPEALANHLNYQWYANGSAISGETSSEYLVKDTDAGKTITVTVTGDGESLFANSLTSNACTVKAGVRPTGYTITIASWDYDYTADNTSFETENAAENYSYSATGGEKAEGAVLTASVDAVNDAKIKWVDVGDEFKQTVGTLAKDRVPVIEPSSKNSIAWGAYPYFETAVTTKGYENITFSAYLGGTKKGPNKWKVQYSLDGNTYTDVESAEYTITANKTMVEAFSDISLPSECDNQKTVYIRIVSSSDTIISPPTTKYLTEANMYSGAAAINNVAVKGSLLSAITSLDAPEIYTTSDEGDSVYSTDNVVIRDTNGGADVYYSIDGSDAVRYTGEFNPFDTDSRSGDSVTITAWSQFADIVSDTTQRTVTFNGADIAQFSYNKYPKNETNGTVYSTGGEYGESSKMTAYADGTTQYPPLWNDGNSAFAVAPDDGLVWTESSGFTFETSTVGYEDIAFTCKAYTTAQGPKSVSLQYSLDGENWNSVSNYTNVALPTELSQFMLRAQLPAECAGKRKVFIRLATTENSTNGGAILHNNNSKGNLYINDIIISGNYDGEMRMPYTEKSTDYFKNGAIEYVSPDGLPMKYTVTDINGDVIGSGDYTESGIVIATLDGFNSAIAGPYTVTVWSYLADERSVASVHNYYYKGDTIAAFKYNSERPFDAYLSDDGYTAYNTAGGDLTSLENRSTLSMYPNGSTSSLLSYTDVYGVKVEWQSDNRYNATKVLDNPASNGYWLIETSTLGYENITLNLEQVSSNKGPRDWGVAYSTNGSSYTYVANSNVRAISNDAYSKSVETYNNLLLPPECNDKSKLYIKIFINGGETVDGNELSDTTINKGNTGIKDIEISGILLPGDFDMNISTVLQEDAAGTYGAYPVDTDITVNGVSYDTENGIAAITVTEGEELTIVANAGRTFEKTVTVIANSKQGTVTIPVIDSDMNGDGIINAKDYAYLNKLPSSDKQTKYKGVFENLINVTEQTAA